MRRDRRGTDGGRGAYDVKRTGPRSGARGGGAVSMSASTRRHDVVCGPHDR